MIRRLIFLVFIVVVPLAVVILAALPVVTKSGWAERRLHELITIQLAQSLQSEVRLGSIEGDLVRGFRIKDLAISEGKRLADGAVLSIDEIAIDCNLWSALKGDRPVVEAIDEVRLVGLKARIKRDGEGGLNIQRFLDLRKPSKKGPPTARFQGRIVVEDAELSFSSDSPSPPFLYALDLLLTDVDAEADFADPRCIAWELAADGTRAPLAWLEADGVYGLENKAVSVHATVAGVNVGDLASRFPVEGVGITSGAVNAEANICAVPGEFVDYSIVGHASGVGLQLAALKGERITASSDFQLTPVGVELENLSASAFGASITGQGAVFDLKDPVIDAEIQASGIDLERLTALAPEVRESLPELLGIESTELAAHISGPVLDPDIVATASLTTPLRVAYTLPPGELEEGEEPPLPRTIRAQTAGLTVAASVLDIESRDVVLRATADELQVGALDALLPEQDYLRELSVAPLQDVTAEVVYSLDSPATTGRLTIDRLDTEHGPVRGVSVQYAYIGTTARADVVIDSALGAPLDAEALVDWSAEEMSVYAEFDVADVDVAQAAEIAQQDLDVEGTVSASGVARLVGDQYQVAAHVIGEALRYEAAEVDHLTANVEATNEAIDVRYASALSPLGTLWAQGSYDFDGPVSGQVAVAGVSLDKARALADEFGDSEARIDTEKEPVELAGVAFARASIDGELKKPHVVADLAVIGPGYEEWSVAAVTGSVDATPERVSLTNALVRRGTVALSAEALLTDIAWAPGSFFSEEESLPEGQEPPPLDATLSASVWAGGLDLSQVGEFVELPHDLRLVGVAELSAEAGGTIREPTVRARATVEQAQVALLGQDIAAGPMEIDAAIEGDLDRVTLHDATVESDAGRVRLAGELTELRGEEPPYLSATFEATDIPLQDYTPLDGLPSMVSGTVDSVKGTVEGRLAEPWPAVTAEVSAKSLALGRGTLGDVDLAARYEDGLLAFDDVALGIAGGRIEAESAAYSISEQKLFAELSAQDLSVPDLLFWVGDLAAQGSEDPEALKTRDGLYGLAHRLEGTVGLDTLVVGGTLEDIQGRIAGLTATDVTFDKRAIPDIEASCRRFSGIALASGDDEEAAEAPEDEKPSPIENLRVEELLVGAYVKRRGDREAGALPDISLGGALAWSGDVEVHLSADLVPLGALSDWTPESLDLSGLVNLDIQARGLTHDPEITATLDVWDPEVAGVKFDMFQVTGVRVGPDRIDSDQILLAMGDHAVEAKGYIPIDRANMKVDTERPVEFEARLDELPLAVLVDVVDQVGAHGSSDYEPLSEKLAVDGLTEVNLEVEGSLSQPKVHGNVYVEDGASIRSAKNPDAPGLEKIGVDVTFGLLSGAHGAWANVLRVDATYDEVVMGVKGEVEMTEFAPEHLLENKVTGLELKAKGPRLRLPDGTTFAKNVDLLVTGHTDDSGWHVLSIDRGSADMGKGQMRLSGGALIDTLHAAHAAATEEPLLASLAHIPCSVAMRFDKAGPTLGKWVSRSRAEGLIVAENFASWTGRPLPDVPFIGDRARGADPNALIAIESRDPDSPARWMPVELTRTTAGIPIPIFGGKSEPEKEEAAPRKTNAILVQGLPYTLPAPKLNVGLAIGHSVSIETALLKGEFVPDRQALLVRGTPQAPEIAGRAQLRRGNIRLLRGSLEIPDARASIEVSPVAMASTVDGAGAEDGAPEVSLAGVVEPPRTLEIEGSIYGRAEGTVSGTDLDGSSIGPVKITLEISGELPPPFDIRTTSNPPVSDEESLRLLTFGQSRPGEEIASGEAVSADQMVAQALSDRLMRGVLQPLEEEISSVLGLEQFQIGVGLNQPVQMRVGKYLVDNLLLSYERGAGGPNDEFDLRLSYALQDRYQATWHTDEDQRQEFTVEYTWQF